MRDLGFAITLLTGFAIAGAGGYMDELGLIVAGIAICIGSSVFLEDIQ